VASDYDRATGYDCATGYDRADLRGSAAAAAGHGLFG
jgi:hypothetical protein